jgi:sulfur-carrier protein
VIPGGRPPIMARLRGVRVLVHYFAATREAVGCPSESVELADGGTVASLVAELTARHPALARASASLRFAVDEDFVSAEARLTDGAEVALIPPVGGG